MARADARAAEFRRDPTAADVAGSGLAAEKIARPDHKAAMDRLIANKKVMSMSDYHALDGLAASGALSRDAKTAISGARRAVMHTPNIIGWFRDWIVWLFAFGLTGSRVLALSGLLIAMHGVGFAFAGAFDAGVADLP